MAKIKCRYRQYWCWFYKWNLNDKKCEYNHCESCNRYLDNEDYTDCTQSPLESCKHAISNVIEFEREVKEYELNRHAELGYFKARGINIDIRNIDYLEIDGEVKVNFEAQGGT